MSMMMAMNTQTGTTAHDWHPADVKAALEKRGISLRQLALAHGYKHFQRVLKSPWWAAEQIVAKALDCPAEQIWPTRYAESRTRARNMTHKISVSRRGQIRCHEGRS